MTHEASVVSGFSRTLRTVRTSLLAAAVLIATGSLLAQGGKTYKARLSPVPMTTAMASTVAGLGSATATLSGNKLTISGTFDGLRSPATIAQIHRAPRGIRGPVVFDLKVSAGTPATSGTISGTIDLTPTQVADLEKGWLYIQLHSERAPDGNLWGWLLLPENKR
jgi:hypothetical protein